MRSKLSFVLIIALALSLAACGGKKSKQPDAEVEDRGIATGGINDQGPIGGELLDDGSDPLSKRRVYFAFDSSTIDDESRRVIEAHATYLADNASLNLVLEGHADERGTREYNLALGERRAKVVARTMQALGVTADRIQSVSYGEERPVALGHNESAWRLNRRVEIIYGN